MWGEGVGGINAQGEQEEVFLRKCFFFAVLCRRRGMQDTKRNPLEKISQPQDFIRAVEVFFCGHFVGREDAEERR